MSIDKILDRVRKLLALSNNTHSEEEAASAASQAARLMEEYQLTEALVALDSPADRRHDPIVNWPLEPAITGPTKRVAWRQFLAATTADDLEIMDYLSWTPVDGGMQVRIMGCGRQSAIETWRYTHQMLCREVDKLCEEAWKEFTADGPAPRSTRAWKNAFRVGCAMRICTRIQEAGAIRRANRKTRVEAAMATLTPEKQAGSLAILDKDHQELEEAWEAERATFTRGSASSIGQVTSYSGFQAGQEAGDRVSIGGARAGLTSTPARLTK